MTLFPLPLAAEATFCLSRPASVVIVPVAGRIRNGNRSKTRRGYPPVEPRGHGSEAQSVPTRGGRLSSDAEMDVLGWTQAAGALHPRAFAQPRAERRSTSRNCRRPDVSPLATLPISQVTQGGISQRVETTGRHIAIELVIPSDGIVLREPLAELPKLAFAEFADGGLKLLDGTHAWILVPRVG